MSESPQVRAGVYGRQSHGKEASVADQVDAGGASCAALGATRVEVYRDGVSASRFGTKVRGDWSRLVADVECGQLDLIWLWDASRGDRTPESWFAFLGACRARGVMIHAERDQRTYDVRIPRDWKTLAESGVDAAYESEIRSVDVRRGLAGAASKGKPHGRAPYGYTRVYDPIDRKIVTQQPNEHAPIVREVIERVAHRDSMTTIIRNLNERGVASPWGAKWSHVTLRKLATNPAYVGLRAHHDELFAGNWPGLVDRVLWEDARAVLNEPRRKASPPGALRYLLSYSLLGPCSPCDGAPADSVRKRAATYRCGSDGCRSIGMIEADEYVVRVVLARLALPDARALFAEDDAAAAAARGVVAAIEAEARELETAARAGMRPALVAAADEGIQERLLAAQARVGVAGGHAAALALLGTGEFTAETGRPRWEALSVAARRTVISALIERIELLPTDVRVTRWTTADERLELASDRIDITWRKR